MARRLLRATLLAIGSLLLLEALCWLLFGVAFRQRFSYSEAARLRAQRLAEAAAATHPPGPRSDPNSMVPHPYLGFVYNPRFDTKLARATHTVPVSEWGFLDDKLPLRPAADDEVVIGVFGGSVAFWFSVQGVDAMLGELSRVPKLSGKRLVIVRTALGGYKQPQQLMTLSYLLALGGHFDVVVNIDGFNDVALAPEWEVPKGVFPFFPRGWPELLGSVGDPDFSRLIGRVLYLEALAGKRASQFSHPPLCYSVSATMLWRILDRNLANELASARFDLEAYKPRPTADRRRYAATGPPRTYPGAAEMYRDLAATWSRSSLQMHQLCAANGIRYFHFLQPNQYVVDAKPMGRAERATAIWPGSAFERSVRAGFPLLRDAGRQLASQGVEFHDLTGVFAGKSDPLYIDNCCHFNPQGNVIVGRAIGRSIAAAMARQPREQ